MFVQEDLAQPGVFDDGYRDTGESYRPERPPMIVTVKPLGREEYRLDVDGEVSCSSAIFGGYEQAQIPCLLSDEQRKHVRGGRLRIHGKNGIFWQGIVTKRPDATEPLIARGWGWCATWNRRAAMFCDTSLTAWSERSNEARDAFMACTVDSAGLLITLEADYTFDGWNGFVRDFFPAVTGVVSFDWARSNNNIRVHWIADGAETEVVPAGSGAMSGSVSASVTDLDSFIVGINATSFTAGANSHVRFSNVKVYGVSGVTSTTTTNVLNNIIDNELEYFYMPIGAAYRQWIGSETTAIEPLAFDSCHAEAKIEELTRQVAWAYGWYMEPIDASGTRACVPHWYARSTTPDYVVRLEEADDYDIDEAGLDELASAIRVGYTDTTGQPAYTDVLGSSGPLCDAGITRYADVAAQTTTGTAATAIGTVALADMSREQLKGTVTTAKVYDTNGAEVYLPTIRPGRMVRLTGLPQGAVDARIERVTLADDVTATIELDNEPYDLSLTLARLAKQSA